MQKNKPEESNTVSLPNNSRPKTNRYERGQSMLEFSFILVFMLILLAGVADLGRAFFTYITLRDAAQEGALYGSINPTATAAIKNRAINSSNMVQDLADAGTSPLKVNVSYTGTACNGDDIQVMVTHEKFPITMPFLGTLLGTQHVKISASIIDQIITPQCP